MKPTFYARHSFLILAVIAFLLPFTIRGARMSAEKMKNDVKDWLPSGFEETQQLDWFRRHFIGEQFVLISWEGCQEGDERLKLLQKKLTPPVADARIVADKEAHAQAKEEHSELLRVHRLGLRPNPKFDNWGGREEKWLQAADGGWYFVLPNGELFEWKGKDTIFPSIRRFVTRDYQAVGERFAFFGNRVYQDPWQLADPLFKTVTTGPGLLATLTKDGSSAGLTDEQGVDRLRGILFGPDGKQTCLIVTLSERAKENLHVVCGRGMMGKPRGRIYTLAEQCGINENQLRLGGPPIDNVAIDEEGTITLVRLVGLSVILGVALSYMCFRSFTATFLVFSIGAIAAVMSLSLVWWCGSTVDAVLMSMPSLVYVLGISGAVHLINYYRSAVEEGGYHGAAEKAIAHGWKPALLCSVTTALGLASLATSDIEPIRKFGIFSAMSVIATLILLFTLLPAALTQWPLKFRGTLSNEPSWLERKLSTFWERLGTFIINHYVAVGAACLIFAVAVGWGVDRMKTSVQLIKMFDSKAKIIEDYQWLEANLGKLVPMELVIRVDPNMLRASDAEVGDEPGDEVQNLLKLNFLERMEIAKNVQRVIADEFGEKGRGVVGQTMSAATFAPELPEVGGGFSAFARRGGTNRRLETHREKILHSDYLRLDDDGSELWRISIRLGAFNDVDYGEFVGDLKGAVEPVMAAYLQRENILKQLAAGRGAAPSGANVLLVADAAKKDPAEGKQAAARRAANFNRTLYELLTVARLRMKAVDAATLAALPADATLPKADCVVLLNDVPSATREQLAKIAPLVIDARPTIDVAIEAQPQTAQASIGAVYTGVVPLVYKAQRTLLAGLVDSTFYSFVTITPLLMFVTRSFWAGLVAMIPNVVPVAVIFGAMGWLGIDVDIGSMMTASIALGVAVDDTIHFLTWYRAELATAPTRREAIIGAYKHCATPTFQTALISGLGLSIFAFSTFTPTQRFGYLMLAILTLGMFAELICLPALLASPLGRTFKKGKASDVHDAPTGKQVEEPRTVVPAPHHPATARNSLPNAAH